MKKPLFKKGQHVKFFGERGVVVDPNYEKRLTRIELVGSIPVPVVLIEKENGKLTKIVQTAVLLA